MSDSFFIELALGIIILIAVYALGYIIAKGEAPKRSKAVFEDKRAK